MIFIFLPHDVSLDQLRAIREDGVKFGIAERHDCWADAPPRTLGGSRATWPSLSPVTATLPTVKAQLLDPVAADVIRTAICPTTPGFAGLIDRFLVDRYHLIRGAYVSIALPFLQGQRFSGSQCCRPSLMPIGWSDN
jgi:hypothetical protein